MRVMNLDAFVFDARCPRLKSSALSKTDEQRNRQPKNIITITIIITQTHFANAFPTDEGTPPPSAAFLLLDEEAATLAARGEKANALAEVATSASRANFFIMMAIILGDEVGGGVGVGAHTKTTSTLNWSKVGVKEDGGDGDDDDVVAWIPKRISTHAAYVLQARDLRDLGNNP